MKQDLSNKIQQAIERGKERYTENQKALDTAAKAKAKRDAEEAAKRKAEMTAAFEFWIENQLPNIIELETAKGWHSIDLSKVELAADKYHCYTDLLAEVCKNAGLNVETTQHDVAESTDWDFRHDAYTYFTHRLRW